MTTQIIQIGDFIITRNLDGSLWLAKEGGEAMELNELWQVRLAAALEDFWEENF